MTGENPASPPFLLGGNMARVWDLIDEETRLKIKSLMPPGWDPSHIPKQKPEVTVEDVEDTDKIMRQTPKGLYGRH